MTPLHTPPAAPLHTSYAPLAPSQDYAVIVQQWVDNTPPGSGEDRTTAANKIIHAAETNLTCLTLSDCRTLTTLPELLDIEGCRALTTLPTRLPAGLVISGYQPPTNPLTQWCLRAGSPAGYIVNLNNGWQQLKTIEGARFNPFEALIDRLAHPDLRNSVPPIAVLEIIEAVIQSPDVRRLIFEASAEAAADCHDRPLTIFNTVQGLAQFEKLQREGAAPQAMLKLAIGMAKLALLDEVTPRVMQIQWRDGRRTGNTTGTGPNMGEALEVQLALRHQLGATLGLPFLVNNPLHATGSAQLNDIDRAFATAYVNKAVSDKKRLTDAMLAQPVWRSYMERCDAEAIEHITNIFHKRMENILDQSTLNEHQTKQAMDTLMRARQDEIDARLKQKTAERLEQLG